MIRCSKTVSRRGKLGAQLLALVSGMSSWRVDRRAGKTRNDRTMTKSAPFILQAKSRSSSLIMARARASPKEILFFSAAIFEGGAENGREYGLRNTRTKEEERLRFMTRARAHCASALRGAQSPGPRAHPEANKKQRSAPGAQQPARGCSRTPLRSGRAATPIGAV